MSIQAMTWVLDHSQTTGKTRLVLLSIGNHADKHGRHAWPNHKTVAEEARCDERTVARALDAARALGELNWIEMRRRTGPGQSRFLYWLPRMLTPGMEPVSTDVAQQLGLTPDILSGVTGDTLSAHTGHPDAPHPTSCPPSNEEPSLSRPEPSTAADEIDNDEPGPRALAGLLAAGVGRNEALRLLQDYGEPTISRQLLNLSRHPEVTRKGGWLIAALRDDYPMATAEAPERLPDARSPEEAEAQARRLWPDKFAP